MQKLFTFYPLSDHPLGQPSPLVFFPHEAVRAVRHPAPAFLAPQRRAEIVKLRRDHFRPVSISTRRCRYIELGSKRHTETAVNTC